MRIFVRTLFLLGLALLAVRMAGRAVRHQAALSGILWVLIGQAAMSGTAGTAKSRATEARLNALVPLIPVQQAQPATTATGAAGMSGGFVVTYNDPGSPPNGGESGANTYGASAGTAHTHGFEHFHTSTTALQTLFSNLASDHGQLITDHNNLKAAVAAAGILT
jgi:hypothetical protein